MTTARATKVQTTERSQEQKDFQSMNLVPQDLTPKNSRVHCNKENVIFFAVSHFLKTSHFQKQNIFKANNQLPDSHALKYLHKLVNTHKLANMKPGCPFPQKTAHIINFIAIKWQ